MKTVVHVSSELSPLGKSGGLADMVDSLGKSQKNRGLDVFHIMPRYSSISLGSLMKTNIRFETSINHVSCSTVVYKYQTVDNRTVYLLDMPTLFSREASNKRDCYGYQDDEMRFAYFSRAAVHMIRNCFMSPDIIHLHDWHTAMVAFYIRNYFKNDLFFRPTKILSTIHNFAHQGVSESIDLGKLGIDQSFYYDGTFEFFGKKNLLKAGLLSCDYFNTVSPTYAQEIMTSDSGFGLDGLIRHLSYKFCGIVNGIDETLWNPTTDSNLPVPFSIKDINAKKITKIELQHRCGLPINKNKPLYIVLSRLVNQKGIQDIIKSMPELLKKDIQILFHGKGDADKEKILKEYSDKNPEKVSAKVGFYSEQFAHLCFGGGDFLLMPSVFEPCGLTQMYSQRYGTIPIVAGVGGLLDTVIDLAEEGRGTGFVFRRGEGAIDRIVEKSTKVFKRSDTKNALQRRGMQTDFSWGKSTNKYLDIYRKIKGNHYESVA